MKTDTLSTRQVAQLLGVGEASVKRWADAGEIDCFRTPGGHRKFRLRDVQAFVQKRDFATTAPAPARPGKGLSDARAFAETALRGDVDGLVSQLTMLRLGGPDLALLFDAVVAPALHEVGAAWKDCKLSIAEEHVASQAVIEAIARVQPLAEPPGEAVRADRGTAVVASVADERHDIGGRMAACLLRARGFEVLAPLAQTPARDLADLILRTRSVFTVLSCTIGPDPAAVASQIQLSAQAARQAGGRLVVGGQGLGSIALPEEVTRLGSMQELVELSESVGRRRAARTA